MDQVFVFVVWTSKSGLNQMGLVFDSFEHTSFPPRPGLNHFIGGPNHFFLCTVAVQTANPEMLVL